MKKICFFCNNWKLWNVSKHTHRKPLEPLDVKFSQPRKTLSFKPSNNLGLDSKLMMGLASLKVYNSIFHVTRGNDRFEVYTDLVDEFSFAELKNELEEILDISSISAEHLQYEMIGPRIKKEYQRIWNQKRDGLVVITCCYSVMLCSISFSRFWKLS